MYTSLLSKTVHVYATFGQKPACICDFWGKNMRIQRRKSSKVGQGSNHSRGVSMYEHNTKCNTKMGRNREQVKHIVPLIPKENKEPP